MKTSCGFVIYCEDSNEILLGRETNSNSWSIPKGGKEDGENSIEAALRELYEESNISKEFIKSCQVFELNHQIYGSKRKKLVPFLAVCKNKPKNLKCNAYFTDSFGESLPEFSKLQWFDFDAVLNGEVKVHGTQMKCFYEAKNKI